MPVVNIGLQRMRDLIRGSGTMNAPVNSVGVGTNDTVDDPADIKLGAGTAPKNVSYWKTSSSAAATATTGGPVTITFGGDGTVDPFVQFEATFGTAEANATLGELGTSAGTLDGTSPAGNDGTKLYTRKKIGPLVKTTDIQVVGRVKITY